MEDSTSTTARCRHCGRELEAVEVIRGAAPMAMPCECDGARREREEANAPSAGMVDAAVAAAGVPPRFKGARHEVAEEVAAAVMARRNVWIAGPVGTGKTHLACAAVRILAARGVAAEFTSMHAIIDETRRSLRGGGDPIAEHAAKRVLVLDDLGKEAATEYALDQIFALVDQRDKRVAPTIVTSQHMPSELAMRLSRHGDADTARAIVSRLRHDCKTVVLDGPDRRIAGGRA